MEIGLIMSLFFLICIVVFVFLAIFLPEWVGITGNKAREVMQEQSQGDDSKPDQVP